MPMKVEIVREVTEGFYGDAVLLRRGDEHFVASSISVCGIPEMLVFPAKADGEVADWEEVAGGRLTTLEEAISQLEHLDHHHIDDLRSAEPDESEAE